MYVMEMGELRWRRILRRTNPNEDAGQREKSHRHTLYPTCYDEVVFLFTFLAPFSVASAALLTPFSVPFATALPLCLAARPVALPASFTSLPAFLAFSLAPSCASM